MNVIRNIDFSTYSDIWLTNAILTYLNFLLRKIMKNIIIEARATSRGKLSRNKKNHWKKIHLDGPRYVERYSDWNIV